MPKKQPMKPLRLFIPITRSVRTDDGKSLFVEGYAYVNAVVGDGWNLKRSAMEAATADYNEWGAVREMHTTSAVGTATGVAVVDGAEIPLGVTWDERGAFLRCLVVDEPAIEKVDRSVYKAFSVGIRVTKARNTDVEECIWFENSLVDRPADTDATFDRFLIARAAGVTDEAGDLETEAEIFEEGETIPGLTGETIIDPAQPEIPVDATDDSVVRGVFADKISKRENSTLRGLAFEILYEALYRIVSGRDSEGNDTDVDPATAARESIQEFADYVAPLVAEAAAGHKELPYEIYYGAGIGEDILKRFAEATGDAVALRGEKDGLVSRVSALEADVVRVTGDLDLARGEAETARTERDAAKQTVVARDARIKELESTIPDPKQSKPHQFVSAERDFLANRSEQILNPSSSDQGAIEALRAEMADLEAKLPQERDEAKRSAGVALYNSLKMKLGNLQRS